MSGVKPFEVKTYCGLSGPVSLLSLEAPYPEIQSKTGRRRRICRMAGLRMTRSCSPSRWGCAPAAYLAASIFIRRTWIARARAALRDQPSSPER